MVELAIAILSVKLLYLIHFQNRVHHMQLWIISSLEWQIKEIRKSLKAFTAYRESPEISESRR